MKIIYLRPYLNGEMYEPPLGIGFIASFLRERMQDLDQEMIDLDILRWDKKRASKELKARNPDVICISVFSYNRFDGFELARMAKESGAFVIFGGQHTTFMDQDTLENVPYIDLIIRGEAEETMYEVLKAKKEGKNFADIKGVSYMQDGKLVRNPDRDFMDITDIRMPAYDLFPTGNYKYYGIMGSRGCPYNCNFCGSPQFWKRKLRLRDPLKVVDEIEYLVKNFGKKIVHMKDDVFTANKEWARKVCEELERRKLDIQWECLTRVNLVDREILAIMKRTGCVLIEYGVETGNDEIMKSIHKDTTKSVVINAVQWTKEAGIKVGTFFMIGHPGETEKTLQETFDFALQLRADALTFTLTDAIPGTALYNFALAEGNIPKDFSWAKSDKRNLSGFSVPRFENKNLPEGQMLNYSRRFIMRFALGRLFDLRDNNDYFYVFKNEYTPYHFTIKSKEDMKIFMQEVQEGWKRSSSALQKAKGLSLTPFFLGRLAKNHAMRVYRKTMYKLKSKEGHIHKESADNNAMIMQPVESVKTTIES